MMRSSDYRYFYLERYGTGEMLKKYLQILDKGDVKKYVREIGEYMYEFEIVDGQSSWK